MLVRFHAAGPGLRCSLEEGHTSHGGSEQLEASQDGGPPALCGGRRQILWLPSVKPSDHGCLCLRVQAG